MTTARPTLLLTRPEPQSRAFAERLERRLERVPQIVIAPVLQIEPVGALPDVTSYRGVIATSARALETARGVAGAQGKPAYCVGRSTAEAARALGMRPDIVAENSKVLIRRIMAADVRGPLVYLRGSVVRTDIADTLEKAGIETHQAVIYEQRARPLTPEALALLAGADPVALPLFSARSARLVSAATVTARAPLHLLAISPAVVRAWSGCTPQAVRVAPAPDGAGMVEIVAGFYRGWPS